MGKIVSVHSFRGGTGKSNLAANLAATLALEGARVAVIDTDIQSPGIHILFDVDLQQATYTLNDYLLGRCSVEQPVIDVTSLLTNGSTSPTKAVKGSIYLLPSSMKVDEITTILSEGYDISLLTSGYQRLMSHLNLDYLLIDTHPGVNEETLLSIGISDILVIILRTDQQDFQGTALTVRVAKQLDVPKMFLVVNKVLPEFDPHDVRETVQSTFDAPVAGLLQLDTDLMRLGSRGIFCLQYPTHPISQEIRSIAKWID